MQGFTTIKAEELRQFTDTVAETAYWSGLAECSYALFYIAFVLGAALLLFACFLPARQEPGGEAAANGWLARLSRRRMQIAHAAVILLLLLCCISQQTTVDDRRGFIAEQDRRYEKAIRELRLHKDKQEALRAEYMYMPEGNSLSYLSLGNTSLAADYLWLTSLQYVTSSFRRGNKFELLLRFYENILDLDPHWVEAAVNGGKVLSALEQDRYAVEKFYIHAIIKNPDNSRLPYEAGRLFVVPPLNPKLRQDYSRRAVEWFKDVVGKLRRLPPNPAVEQTIRELEEMIGRLAVEGGVEYYKVADEHLWNRAHDGGAPRAMRLAAARDWLYARSLLITEELQLAVNEYKAQRGSFPPDLRAVLPLVKDKDLFSLDAEGWPLDAYGFRLDYDSAAGKASSRGAKARRAIQARAIIGGLIEAYRGARGGDAPKDLGELQTFVREHFTTPGNEPGPAIIDAIGMELNAVISPFGTPWDYDPKEGKINLPDYCGPAVLFRNSEKVVGPE